MQPNETSRVFARGAGLRAKARRVGDVLPRQRLRVEDLVAVVVREGNFCGWHKPQIAVLDLERIRAELRQVGRAHHGRAVDEHRRLHLEVAVLARVHVEHELHKRPLQARTLPQQEGEPRGRDARGVLEVHDAQALAKVVMRAR